MAQILTKALNHECHTQAPRAGVSWRGRGHGSLATALLVLLVAVGPCQVQANLMLKDASGASALEDTTRSLTALFSKSLTERSTHEELAGEAAALREENTDYQKVEMLPRVEMESFMPEEEDELGAPNRLSSANSQVDFVWGRPVAALRDLSQQGAAETTTTETSTTTATQTTTTVTTTTQAGGNAPGPSPNTFDTQTFIDASYTREPSEEVLDKFCETYRAQVASELGVPIEQTKCEATWRAEDGRIVSVVSQGRRRLTTGANAQFILSVTTEGIQEASRVTTEMEQLDPATLTTEVVTQIQNDPTVPNEVKDVAATVDVSTASLEVVTARAAKVRAMRGELTVAVGNAGYTNQQVIDFLTEMLVQALADTAGTNVNADNITVSVDSSTNIRFTILSLEATEDVAILDALSQTTTAAVLERILSDSNVDITIDSVSVEWEVFGTVTIDSAAVDVANQRKLTNSSVFSITSMIDSLSAYAQSTYPLTSLQVGVFLYDKIAYVEGDNTSNRIVVTYSYVPSTFEEYCNIAAQQETAAQQALMQAALSYTGVDATILPAVELFDQDPVLPACTEPGPAPVDPDDPALATAVIVLLAVVAVLALFACLFALWWFVLRRRRPAEEKEPPTGDDQEAGEEPLRREIHGTVPESTIQVMTMAREPSADQNSGAAAGGSAEAPESGVHRERGAGRPWDPNHWNAEEEFLEYLDDEPRV